MSTYERPVVASPTFRDVNGRTIEYGNRWGMDSPPEDAYSVDSHPERFRPLHTVAEALITHLVTHFDVDVAEDPDVACDLLRAPMDVVRAVRITPRRINTASLTMVLTSYPSVEVHAGELRDGNFPPCGCDACDYSWETLADDMEELVVAVAGGRFWERMGRGKHPFVESGYSTGDGETSNRAEGSNLPSPRLQRAQKVLAQLPNGWEAWPRRD